MSFSTQSLSRRDHIWKHLALALPVMGSQMGQIFVSMTDNIMVGRLGALPLAAVAFTNSLQAILALFGIGISYGITPLVAEANGAKQPGKAWFLLRHGRLINLAVGSILIGIAFILIPIMPYMDQPQEVVVYCIPYFKVMSLSLLPVMIFQSYRQFTEGLSYTLQAMYISLAGNLLNVGLNYLLIYGTFGFPELGLLGAGYATLISRVLMAVAMVSYVHWHRRFSLYRTASSDSTIQKKGLSQILKIGIPTGFQYIFEVSAFTATAIMMGWVGVNTQAAHQIVINLSALTYLMASGLGSATAIRVGNQLGKKDYDTLRIVGWTGTQLVIAFMTFWAITFMVLNDVLPLIYIQDKEVISIAASLFLVAALFQLSDGVQVVMLGALRGMHDVKIPTLITILSYWVLGIPSGYLMGFALDWGPEGIWAGLVVGLTVAAVLLVWRFHVLSQRITLKGVG